MIGERVGKRQRPQGLRPCTPGKVCSSEHPVVQPADKDADDDADTRTHSDAGMECLERCVQSYVVHPLPLSIVPGHAAGEAPGPAPARVGPASTSVRRASLITHRKRGVKRAVLGIFRLRDIAISSEVVINAMTGGPHTVLMREALDQGPLLGHAHAGCWTQSAITI